MINIARNGNKKAYGIKHYNLDTVEELNELNPQRQAMGTTAFIISTSQYYMVNGSGEWKEINPRGGSTTPEDEIIYDGGGVDNEGIEDDNSIYEGGDV
jgi:hypothetical protein